VLVEVLVGEFVGVVVGVWLGVDVAVYEGVLVGVDVCVLVGVMLGVAVGVLVGVVVGVLVGVPVALPLQVSYSAAEQGRKIGFSMQPGGNSGLEGSTYSSSQWKKTGSMLMHSAQAAVPPAGVLEGVIVGVFVGVVVGELVGEAVGVLVLAPHVWAEKAASACPIPYVVKPAAFHCLE
jgi:hypothetical protein